MTKDNAVLDAATADIEEIEAALAGEISIDDIEIDPNDFTEAEEVELSADEIEAIEGVEEVAETIELSPEDIEAIEEPEQAPEEVEMTDEVIEEPAPAKKASKSKTEAKTETETKPKRPARVKMDFEDHVVALLGPDPVLDSEHADKPLDEDAVRALAKSITQKKVREKVINLLEAAFSDRSLSVYTKIALDEVLIPAFNDGCTPVTVASIKAKYKERDYKDGTASAQSGQMTPLFEALKMVKRGERGVIIPNANSVILDMLAAD